MWHKNFASIFISNEKEIRITLAKTSSAVLRNYQANVMIPEFRNLQNYLCSVVRTLVGFFRPIYNN